MLEVGRLITRELVEVVMLKMLPAVPVETLLMLLTEPKPKEEVAIDIKFLLASVKTRELVERVAMLTLPKGVTERMVAPLEEATTKGLFVPLPWNVTVLVGVVVPTSKMLEMVAVPVMAKVEEALNHWKLAEPAVVDAPVK